MTFIEPLIALFAVGTVGFWMFIALISIWILVELTSNDGRGSFFVHVVAISGLFLILHNISFSWSQLGIGAGIYIVVGGVWSIFKFWRYCKDGILDAKQSVTVTNDDINEREKQIIRIKENLKRKLNPLNNQGRITEWIAYWPWSVFWTLFRDLFKTVFDILTNCYTAISVRALQEFDKFAKV